MFLRKLCTLSNWRTKFTKNNTFKTIRSLRKAFHSTAEEELQKVFRSIKNLPESERKEIEQFVHRLVNKLLHDPSRNLTQLAQEEDSHLHMESIAKLFDLSPAPLGKTTQQQPRLKIIKS